MSFFHISMYLYMIDSGSGVSVSSLLNFLCLFLRPFFLIICLLIVDAQSTIMSIGLFLHKWTV